MVWLIQTKVAVSEVVTTGFAELKELAQQQSETAKRQEQNITRLAGIVETDLKELAQQQSETKELAQQQSETAKRQEQNITRLVGIVEALVQPRS
ncbi:MAG: hypothetical protein KME27_06825 [Lyngbya sp. HA4199-MV5]|nr:hypothetical protein [Lyngbya sp. HA4199-MV5]